jgi:hypothetical protein
VMAFTLVYTAEHYVIDILLGWLLAAVMIVGLRRFESRRAGTYQAPVTMKAAQK